MDGMHDLGGQQGFGPVRYTLNAPAFHAAWEVRVNSLYAFAVRLGIFNMDEYRHAIERMEPRHYLAASYYERSLTSLATLLRREGHRDARGAGAPRAGRVSARGAERAGTHQRRRRASASQPGDRVRVQARLRAGPRAHAGLHPRQDRRRRERVAGLSVSRRACARASRRRTSPPTTCASAARTSGRIRPTRALVHVAVFRAISSERVVQPPKWPRADSRPAGRHPGFRAPRVSGAPQGHGECPRGMGECL